jgi:hypothetical protein
MSDTLPIYYNVLNFKRNVHAELLKFQKEVVKVNFPDITEHLLRFPEVRIFSCPVKTLSQIYDFTGLGVIHESSSFPIALH